MSLTYFHGNLAIVADDLVPVICSVCERRFWLVHAGGGPDLLVQPIHWAREFHKTIDKCDGELIVHDGLDRQSVLPGGAGARDHRGEGCDPRGGRDVRALRSGSRARRSDARSCAVAVLMVLGAWIGASIVLALLWALAGSRCAQ